MSPTLTPEDQAIDLKATYEIWSAEPTYNDPQIDSLHAQGLVFLRRAIAAEERVRELEAQLNPPGKYYCGCPVQRSDKVKAFCPIHLQQIVLTEDGN